MSIIDLDREISGIEDVKNFTFVSGIYNLPNFYNSIIYLKDNSTYFICNSLDSIFIRLS